MKQTIIALLMLLSLTASAQETIENPTEGACSMGVPDAVRNYALNIKDNGESLETNGFSMEPAIVRGKIYGFDRRTFGDKMSAEVKVFIFNPFLGEQLSYSGRINSDNSYEIQVPMTTKHQTVYLGANPIISSDILISAGKTVVVDFDFQQINEPWELPNGRLIPYFSGENVDINYALSLGVSRSLNQELLNYPSAAEKISRFTMKEYKDYVLDFFEDFNTRIDTMPVTKRAKEYLRILMKSEEAYYLSMGSFWIENAYRTANGKSYNDSIPEFKKPVIDESYLDYPKTLDLDNVMMFYADKFSYNISYWNGRVIYDLEKSAVDVESFKNEIFGEGDSYFKDFIKLQEYCQPLSEQAVVPDSIIAEIEKMRFPFYADYVKAKNAEIAAKIKEEKARGGYYVHQASESTGDSLFVDLIKDFKGKVVFIDFWNTWFVPCRQAFKDMEPMEKEFEGKDVVFLFIADESSPQRVYDGMIVSMKGHHYRLNNAQASSLRQKWGFPGIPSYVIVGKDGTVKDFHTGFRGVDYYRAKIERELK